MGEIFVPTEEQVLIATLAETNDALREENSRLRNTHKILRTIIRQLREQARSYEAQIELAKYNDDLFKRFCNGEFDVKDVSIEDGGLPESTGTVEPAVANAEEASAPSTSS